MQIMHQFSYLCIILHLSIYINYVSIIVKYFSGFSDPSVYMIDLLFPPQYIGSGYEDHIILRQFPKILPRF